MVEDDEGEEQDDDDDGGDSDEEVVDGNGDEVLWSIVLPSQPFDVTNPHLHRRRTMMK